MVDQKSVGGWYTVTFQIAKVLSVTSHNEVLLDHTSLEHIHKLSHTASTQPSEATGQLLAFGHSWHSAEHMEI